MIHPEYRLLRGGQDPSTTDTLTPIYPATEGIQQGRLRNLTDQALKRMRAAPPAELLPQQTLNKLMLPSLAEAISYVHRPPADANVELLLDGKHPCQQRLAFEELLAHFLSLKNLRALAAHEFAPSLADGSAEVDAFIADLPFELTKAQQRVVNEILDDLAQAHPR